MLPLPHQLSMYYVLVALFSSTDHNLPAPRHGRVVIRDKGYGIRAPAGTMGQTTERKTSSKTQDSCDLRRALLLLLRGHCTLHSALPNPQSPIPIPKLKRQEQEGGGR